VGILDNTYVHRKKESSGNATNLIEFFQLSHVLLDVCRQTAILFAADPTILKIPSIIIPASWILKIDFFNRILVPLPLPKNGQQKQWL
jgi:hypothetical protein